VVSDNAPTGALAADRAAEEPLHSYLAKDYESFRRLLFDRIGQTLPEWGETHVPDIGVALVELLAYVADALSYHQDAVATEAYLSTARLRTSIRRHCQLVDYRLHDGCNARTWVCVTVGDEPNRHRPFPASSIVFLAVGDPGWTGGGNEVFQPVAGGPALLQFRRAHDRITVRDATPTTATLASATGEPLDLHAGDVVILEPLDGGQDAHPVCLVRDAIGPRVMAEWGEGDALSAGSREWVGRGNVVLVDHGEPVSETLPPLRRDPAARGGATRLLGPMLARAPVAFGCPYPRGGAAAAMLDQDPREAIALLSLDARQGGGPAISWAARGELLASRPEDRHVVAESDDDGRVHLRFGDDVNGRRPAQGTQFEARYRQGGGPAGNVAAHTIVRAMKWSKDGGYADVDLGGVDNPLPGTGGVAPESATAAKLFAPTAFRRRQRRAVRADDYRGVIFSDPVLRSQVRDAAAVLGWTGSGHEVRVAIVPAVRDTPPVGLRDRVQARLEDVRRIGHNVRVVAPTEVSVTVEAILATDDQVHWERVKEAVELLLGTGQRRDKSLGLMHPDHMGLGQAVHASPLIAAVQGVPGVRGADVRLKREWPAGPAAPRITQLDDRSLLLAPLELVTRVEVNVSKVKAT
jgi:hypothetical protein